MQPKPFRALVDVFCFVPDLAEATAWYTERLGTAPVWEAPQLSRYNLGTSSLTLHSIDEFNSGGPGGCVAYWDVPDVDTVAAAWVEHGAVAHRGPKTIATGERLCQLLDPFGNLIGIRQAAAGETRGSSELCTPLFDQNPASASHSNSPSSRMTRPE